MARSAEPDALGLGQESRRSRYLRLVSLVVYGLGKRTTERKGRAGGPFIAGALRDVSGSYIIPWLVFAMMFATAIPAILAVQK